ncbi:MAG: hypothetical protein GYA62_10170 [Bacteroidales bacterium]|nr:hypothetical protein [Bacteroidales bacterium]
MCPVCTVTVVAGLGISRLLGIDDVVTSMWIGAFILSFSFVTIDWINKKWPNFNKNYYFFPTFILMYLFVLIPFKLDGTIGIVRNTLWGIDKIILGMTLGSVIFLIGIWADKFQRKKFPKIFFPYQKVIFPITVLLLASFIFWRITI